MEKAAGGKIGTVNNQGGRNRHAMRPPCSFSFLFLRPFRLGGRLSFRSVLEVGTLKSLKENQSSEPISYRKKVRIIWGLVREAGVEPARPCEHWHLKPASLPIPPLAHTALVQRKENDTTFFFRCQHFLQNFLLFFVFTLLLFSSRSPVRN